MVGRELGHYPLPESQKMLLIIVSEKSECEHVFTFSMDKIGARIRTMPLSLNPLGASDDVAPPSWSFCFGTNNMAADSLLFLRCTDLNFCFCVRYVL